jgi:hypothetical protein
MDDVGWEIDIQQGCVRGQIARMLILIAMRSDKVWAIGSAINGHFAARAAADSANGFSLGGTKPRAFALFTNRATHTASAAATAEKAGYAGEKQKAKIGLGYRAN